MLTPLQQKVMLYLQEYIANSGGVSPSYVEIQGAFGRKSKCFSYNILIQLEERGYIRRLHKRARAIQIILTVPRFRFYRYDRITESLSYAGDIE